MLLATINKPKQLLHISFIGHVSAQDLARHREELVTLLSDLLPGFRLLTDLGQLDSLGEGCAAELGKMMELCDEKGVELVVRVIPNQTKDIGLGILSIFHYHHPLREVTCKNLIEAAELLSL